MSINPNFPSFEKDKEEDVFEEKPKPLAVVQIELNDFIKLHYHLEEATKIFEKYYKKGD